LPSGRLVGTAIATVDRDQQRREQMKIRTSILAAGAVLAIAAPVAGAAVAQVPGEAAVYAQHHSSSTKPAKQVKATVKATLHTGYRVGNGVYGPYSYDPGRSTTKVAPAAFDRMAH
jgi:hypothetical protein